MLMAVATVYQRAKRVATCPSGDIISLAMARKLFVGVLVLAGLGWIGLITYSYFFYNPGPQTPGALRREDQINEFVLKFNQGAFLDKNAELHFDEERPALGFRAPDFELSDLNNQRVRLSALRGKPILLNFWASWCPPCRKEMPDLQQFFSSYGDRISVIGINSNDRVEIVREFLSRYGITYINLLDTDGKVFVLYELTGLPTSFFIDESGIVRGIWLGSMSIADMVAAFQKTTRALSGNSP
jgi:peroxiredoxin